MDRNIDDLFEMVLHRPGLFIPEVQTLRDVLIYIEGAIIGRNWPALGVQEMCSFCEFTNQRRAREDNWQMTPLLSEFGDMPIFQACEALAKALREWKAVPRS